MTPKASFETRLRNYNRDMEQEFQKEGAEAKFFRPLGLSLAGIPSHSWQNCPDKMNPEQHLQFFSALHFIKYRISRGDNLLDLYIAVRNRITSANIGLVYKCLNLTYIQAEEADLSSAGSFALIRAVENFDPWRNTRFATYACRAILRSFTIFLRRKHRTVTLPEDDLLLVEVEKPEQRDESMIDGLVSLLNSESRGGLSEREYKIIMDRFGIGRNPRILCDIAADYGVSRERIRQIEQRALDKLEESIWDALIVPAESR